MGGLLTFVQLPAAEKDRETEALWEIVHQGWKNILTKLIFPVSKDVFRKAATYFGSSVKKNFHRKQQLTNFAKVLLERRHLEDEEKQQNDRRNSGVFTPASRRFRRQ